MLFLVISTPRPERPSEWAAARRKSWDWWEPLEKKGVVKWYYARAGRGAEALCYSAGRARKVQLSSCTSTLAPLAIRERTATAEARPRSCAQRAQPSARLATAAPKREVRRFMSTPDGACFGVRDSVARLAAP